MTNVNAPHDPEALIAQQENIQQAVREGRRQAVLDILDAFHPADVAEFLEPLPPSDREILIGWLRPQFDADVLAYLDPEIRDDVVGQMNPGELAEALEEMDSDDAVGVLEDISPDTRAEIMAKLLPDTRLAVEEGLTFPEYSAGRLMQTDLVAVPPTWTVEQTLQALREKGEALPVELYQIFVVDGDHRVRGAVMLAHLLRTPPGVSLDAIMDPEVRTIPATMGQEDVAFLFRKYGLVCAPVVDDKERLLGVIMVDDVVDVIEEEAQDDILSLGRVGESDIYANVWQTVGRRFRWLGVTLINTIIASLVIAQFEATIQQIVTLAVLMPIVAAMAGNAGMQVVTITVRALATRDLQRSNVLRIVWKEVTIGIINGLVFAMILGGLAAFWFQNPKVAGVLALAMTCNMMWAGLAGTLIPLTLDKMGIDPAVAAGPFLTTTTDVLGFLLFLGMATWFLL